MNGIFLGVDAGVGLVKACAFTRDGEALGKAQKAIPIATPRRTWAEIDPEGYWLATAHVCREALRRVGRVDAVGVVSSCPTTIFLDRSGSPLRAGIPYLDRRCDGQVRRFAEARGGGDAVLRDIGNHPFSSTCWLGNAPWMRENEPGLWKKTRRVGMLSSFLVHRLTGSLVVDPTQASFSGAFDIRRPEAGWRKDLLAEWGVPASFLPRLKACGARAGALTPEAAEALGVEPGAPVACGAADTAAASLAAGQRDGGEALETIGTAGVMTFCLERPEFHPAFLNRCGVFPGSWLAHGAMSTIGGAFAWLKNKVWPELVSIAELEQMAAESPAGANGLVFLPYLAGERTPIWDPEARGAWIGLRLDSARADMARAVFEGAAYGMRQMLELARESAGQSPSRIFGVGGGSRSRFWTQLKREIFGIEYAASSMPDAAAWGAAILGAVAGGFFSGIDDPEIRFLRPDPAKSAASRSERIRLGDEKRKAAYDQAYAVYKKLYPALKDVMHAFATM